MPNPLMDKEKGKDLMLLVADVLDHLNIPFFLMQGTALGAYRDGGFVPTERDIDFGILQEHFDPPAVAELLIQKGCEIEVWGLPFNKARIIVAKKWGCKCDVVGMIKWKKVRFTSTLRRPRGPNPPYSLVHEAVLVENYEQVEAFGRKWNLPSPIETYLEREYGPEWRIPQDNHVSLTRKHNFILNEGIPDDHI